MPARLLLLPLLVLAACAARPPHAETAGSATRLVSARLGQTVAANGLRITPLTVHEDSRCPADAICVQAGTLRLEARLEAEVVAAHRVLVIDQPSSLAGRQVELVAGCPYPFASQPAPPAQRVFVFAVGAGERPKPDNPPDYCAAAR